MRKDNPTVIGEIRCTTPGCNHIAQVRERSNGQKLKYLYCEKQCKVTQTAGEAFQKYIQDNMRPVGSLSAETAQTDAQAAETVSQTEPQPEQPAQLTESNPLQTTETATDPEPDLWRPSVKAPNQHPTGTEAVTQKRLSGVHIVGILLLAGTAIGGLVWFFRRRSAEPVAAGA
ncbi:hypothetical protein [Bowmanella denitrificans]|uniref:hypothetical protein n=1 Tax=Bowmanella denitrificans TaxID=366582 RepID=UPI000C997FA9|nr:hypothetical protein [Bowmanella denitrificans]